MNHTRSWDILTPHLIQRTSVALIGVGGIGAATAVTLAKMGVGYLYLYDPDVVEEINISTQLLRVSDVGKWKVASVIRLMKDVSDIRGVAYPERVTALSVLPGDIIISSVDTVGARQDIWSAVLGSPGQWYLDARMASESLQLWTVDTHEDTHWYEDPLLALSEDDVPDEPCTAKATFYLAAVASGLIGSQVKRIVMGQVVPRVIALDIPSFQLIVPSGEFND